MKLSEAKKLAAQVVRAEIEGTAISHDGKKEFVVYLVKCTTRDGHDWQCRKRFSEFVQLKADMEMTGCPGVEDVKLPPKRVLRANGARVVEERVAGLQHFLAKAIAMYVDHGVLIQFLARPPDCGPTTRAPPGWRLKESRERLEQLREMVSDLRAKVGESDPTYQAMLAKLQQESRAFKAGQSAVTTSDEVRPSLLADGGRQTVGGATRAVSAPTTPRTPMRQTVGAISELEREKEIQLQHGALSHDRGRELQKELHEQKLRATPAKRGGGGGSSSSSSGGSSHLFNSDTFGKKYSMGRLLGEGTFGRVYQCTHNDTHGQVAVKMVPTNQKHFSEADLLEETRLQQLCGDHPNIVQIFDLFKEKKALYLVQEVVGGGDLFSILIKRQSAADAAGLECPFTEAAVAKIVVQIVSAIAHCHARGVMHRDLKPENILCLADDESQLKLCDFGLACEFEQDRLILKQAGSVEYAAPEVLTYGVGYGPPADVWSIGVITYVLLCGRLPFRGASPKEAVEAVLRMPLEFPSPEWDLISLETKTMIAEMMLNRDPSARITAQELLEHPWLSGAAPDLALGSTLSALKGFNSRTRFRRAVNAMIAARRMQLIMSSLFQDRQALDFSRNYTIDHVHKLCAGFALESGELHSHSPAPQRGMSKRHLRNRKTQGGGSLSHKNYIPVETFAEVLDAALDLNGDTSMVSLHENAFATGYLRRWIDYVSYLLGLATSFGATTEEKLTHAFGVLCKLDEENSRKSRSRQMDSSVAEEAQCLHLGEFIALIDSTEGLVGEHDEAAVNRLFRALSADEDGEESLADGSDTMNVEQFLSAVHTTPQLSRYFASIGQMIAPLQTGDAQTQSSAFASDMDARAAQCPAAATATNREGAHTDEKIVTELRGSLQTPGRPKMGELGMVPQGLGGGRPGREHGARSPSPPQLSDEKLFGVKRAFALYDTGDGTVARADGWRLLQTLGVEKHSPEDFEQLLLPTPLPVAVGRLSGGASMLAKSVSNAAAQAGVTPVKESVADDLDNAGQTLQDPFKVSLEEFCNALRRREAETQQNERLAEEQRLATPLTREQRSQLLRQSVADGTI